MNLLYAACIALIAACGIHLLLSRHLLRTVLGVALLSAATNLVIFLAGRLGPAQPPVIAAGEETLRAGAANPLPQALVLTAIVIGFSLVAYACALVLRTHRALGTLDGRELRAAEAMGAAFPRGERRDA